MAKTIVIFVISIFNKSQEIPRMLGKQRDFFLSVSIVEGMQLNFAGLERED